MGEIDNISTYHTTIRKFDGTMVFMPNAKIMTSTIMNYYDVPERRIEMYLTISADSNIEEVKKQLSNIINDDERVLKDPAPSMYITGVEARGLSLSAYCWVENGDWLSARSDLFAQVQNTFMQNDSRKHILHVLLREKNTTQSIYELSVSPTHLWPFIVIFCMYCIFV